MIQGCGRKPSVESCGRKDIRIVLRLPFFVFVPALDDDTFENLVSRRPGRVASKNPSSRSCSPCWIRSSIWVKAYAAAAPARIFSRLLVTRSYNSRQVRLKTLVITGPQAAPASAPTGPAVIRPIAAPATFPAISLPGSMNSRILSLSSGIVVHQGASYSLLQQVAIPAGTDNLSDRYRSRSLPVFSMNTDKTSR